MIGRWTHWAVDRFREQPFGEYVYLTGRTFARLPKKLWVADQPGRLKDASLQVQCPETLLGKASVALLNQEFDKVKGLLQEALDAGISPHCARQMIEAVGELQREKRRP